jgi:hypothetical protein
MGKVKKLNQVAPAKEVTKKQKGELSTAVVVASLEKQAEPYFAKLTKYTSIDSQEDFEAVGEQLKLLKNIEAAAKEEENMLTEGIKQSLNRIREHFKPFRAKVANTELTYKLMLSAFVEKSKKKIAALDEAFTKGNMKVGTYAKKAAEIAVPSSNNGAKIRRVWTAVVTDEKKIPREFLTPDISAITAAFKEDPTRKIPGVSWEQKEQIAI